MATIERVAMFDPGVLHFTPGVLATVDQDDILKALVSHIGGDWGDVDEHDRQHNDYAARHGGLILSVYTTRRGITFWVRTEPHHSLTTFLLPEEC